MTTTIKLEIHADQQTYGGIVDRLLEAGAVAITIDVRTPSAASSPLFTLEVPKNARHSIAESFGHTTWDEFLEDRVNT